MGFLNGASVVEGIGKSLDVFVNFGQRLSEVSPLRGGSLRGFGQRLRWMGH